MMARWLKFNAAGLLGVGVQLAVLRFATHTLGLHYLWATALAVETAVLHNFLWHERYTWRIRTRSDSRSALRRLLYFNFSNGAVSLAGNLLVMRVLMGVAAFPVELANAVAISACSVLNFLIAEFFVFGRKPKEEDGGLFV